jgi:hypothetical protein
MLSNTKTTIAVLFLCSPQAIQGASIPFHIDVVASENGFLLTGKEVFGDMPYAAFGIYPFNYVNGGNITILNVPSEFTVINQSLNAKSAIATDLNIVFGSGSTMTGTLDQALTLNGASFVTGWADIVNGFANPVPAIQPYLAGPDSTIGLYLFHGTASEELLLSGTFHWLNLEVTADASDPDLVVVSRATGELTFDSAESGYENVFQEILTLTGGTGTVEITTDSFAHSPGLSDPGLFHTSGDAELLFSPLNGNFDNDDNVDGSDFVTWQRYPSLGSLSEWQANYGQPAGSIVAAKQNIPEPATWLLLVVFVLVMMYHYRLVRT